MYQLAEIIDRKDMSKEISAIEIELVEMYKPNQFWGDNNIEVQMVRNQNETGVVIENHLKMEINGTSVMRYYSILDMMEKEAREKKRLAGNKK